MYSHFHHILCFPLSIKVISQIDCTKNGSTNCICVPYIHGSWTMTKQYGIKMKCYWECLWEQMGNFGNILGTWWKYTGNQKKTKPPSLPKTHKKNIFLPKSFSLVAWNFYFQNGLSTFSILTNTHYGLKVLICDSFYHSTFSDSAQ
jgi:hypothetical protein